MLIKLAIESLKYRKGSVVLTCVAMMISVFVLLGVEHTRKQAKDSFASTVSGVDLIIGARSGSLNLLLYSVFRIGSPVNNISWESYQKFKAKDEVAWTIPISLGDSHLGYRVLGSTEAYFDHYQYGRKQRLVFESGSPFTSTYDVVLGAAVADKLDYKIGDSLVLSHGIAATSFEQHTDSPFVVKGILSPTGTPVDQTLHVKLEGIEAIHQPPNGKKDDLQPSSITAFIVGLKSRMDTFRLQREVNEFQPEALSAILPGVALTELWSTMSMLEGILRLISALVFIAALLGMIAMMAASLRERSKEIQLLRIIGATATSLFLLVQLEAVLISVLSILGGAGILALILLVSRETISTTFGVHLDINIVNENTGLIALAILITTLVVAAFPAFLAYRQGKTQI
ncbi:MAG: ABC transporter permease [Gammaproteobacteria bacterium]|nr:ABC transporter permease [Gammaproteobacteria bacterium]